MLLAQCIRARILRAGAVLLPGRGSLPLSQVPLHGCFVVDDEPGHILVVSPQHRRAHHVRAHLQAAKPLQAEVVEKAVEPQRLQVQQRLLDVGDAAHSHPEGVAAQVAQPQPLRAVVEIRDDHRVDPLGVRHGGHKVLDLGAPHAEALRRDGAAVLVAGRKDVVGGPAHRAAQHVRNLVRAAVALLHVEVQILLQLLALLRVRGHLAVVGQVEVADDALEGRHPRRRHVLEHVVDPVVGTSADVLDATDAGRPRKHLYEVPHIVRPLRVAQMPLHVVRVLLVPELAHHVGHRVQEGQVLADEGVHLRPQFLRVLTLLQHHQAEGRVLGRYVRPLPVAHMLDQLVQQAVEAPAVLRSEHRGWVLHGSHAVADFAQLEKRLARGAASLVLQRHRRDVPVRRSSRHHHVSVQIDFVHHKVLGDVLDVPFDALSVHVGHHELHHGAAHSEQPALAEQGQSALFDVTHGLHFNWRVPPRRAVIGGTCM
ncbi:N-ethylmaleimide sensitive fusion protein, putative [Babesia caballi]|uniref:N-ethylmaleimide sensitive fusion protein, putative n=1 Tax=Babesia caballi TaxID=5871 RepID=A0AAV4LTA8_BABCB|nr:N-ethylmaleimide sensitive fusion protein, putative [Babesia caballi]